MEILIGASVGLYLCKDKYYMQLITSENENSYFMQIPKESAEYLSAFDRIKIDQCDQLPGGVFIKS